MKIEKPYKFTIICNKTGKIVREQDNPPITHELQTWEQSESDPNIKELMQTRTAYVDTRFDARMRLFLYVNFTRQGKDIPKYRPFNGTEIGKSIPILGWCSK